MTDTYHHPQDSLSRIIDDLRQHATETGEYNSAMDFIHFADRLEALRAQPDAWMNEKRSTCSDYSKQFKPYLKGLAIPLIRAD